MYLQMKDNFWKLDIFIFENVLVSQQHISDFPKFMDVQLFKTMAILKYSINFGAKCPLLFSYRQ